jgi:DNA polymerase I-like protein with 3'-5' exonuclease and polymerase domains
MRENEVDLRRIRNLVGEDCDLDSDEQVTNILKRRFNIYLPQRRTLTEALRQTNCDHEIIDLLLKQRAAEQGASVNRAAQH